MDYKSNILVNIHSLKNYLSKYYKVDLNKINFIKSKDGMERVLIDKMKEDSMNLHTTENLFGFKVERTMNVKMFKHFDNTIINFDGNCELDGQCIQSYFQENKIKENDYTFFVVAKQTQYKFIRIDVIMTDVFNHFIKNENNNIELNIANYDRDVINLNQLYFGNISMTSTLN
jgi:hypothetical protein